MSSSEEEEESSSSYEEETESSTERAWTCNDLYSESDKGDKESSGDDDESSSEDDDSKPSAKPPLARHSSGEVEVMLKSQEAALKDAHAEEEKRRLMVTKARNLSEEKNKAALSTSEQLNEELESLNKQYDSSDETMKSLEAKVANKRNAPKKEMSMEKVKFQQRNAERELRLAKARERIEKKKDEQEQQEAEKKLKEAQGPKLDMSKASRVERAYSWYTRMAMPTRDKMKERVEFMPASAGVTPDDVDLLPWNARGTFVSVAAMMRMNRTAATTAGAASVDSEDSDSD